MGQRYCKTDNQKPWISFSHNQDFAVERGLTPHAKMSKLEDVLIKVLLPKRTTDGDLGWSTQPPKALGVWGQSI